MKMLFLASNNEYQKRMQEEQFSKLSEKIRGSLMTPASGEMKSLAKYTMK